VWRAERLVDRVDERLRIDRGYPRLAMGLYGRFMLSVIKRAEAVPVMHKLLVPLDRRIFRLTKGRASLAHFGAGNAQVMQNLLLTTTGRRSGKPRDTPLLFLDHEDAG
jgi:hypothetical protein